MPAVATRDALARVWRRLIAVMDALSIQKVNLRDGDDIHRLYSHGNISFPCGQDAPLDTYCENHHHTGLAPIWERKHGYRLCHEADPELVCWDSATARWGGGQWTNNPIMFTKKWFYDHVYLVALNNGGKNGLEAVNHFDYNTARRPGYRMNGTLAVEPQGWFQHEEVEPESRQRQ